MGNEPPWLIVTDLDGTLLDDAYDLASAAAAVDEQSARGRVVALASSKTLDEMLALATLCAQPPVLIFENGAGIAWPDESSRAGAGDRGPYQVTTEGAGYAALRARLRALRRSRGYRFLGFGDMSASDVMRFTGLGADGARLARHRTASEPVMWLDTPERLAAFRGDVMEAGYRLVAGGRFQHVMPRTDKARGLRQVVECLGRRTRSNWRVAACGDAANDLAMLEAADCALVFPQRDGSYLRIAGPAGGDVGIHVAQSGPAAWSAALDRTLGSRPYQSPRALRNDQRPNPTELPP
jgi:mannosyl-3-phosphoglycerate phosphatase